MKKKFAAGALSAVLLVGGATAAFGATDPDKLAEIKTLTQQMFGIQKQIVDKEAEAGLLTSQQADTKKKFIDQRQQSSDEGLANGKVFGLGKGMGMRDSVKKLNTGEPMTEEQIKTWSEAAEARLIARVEAMKSNGKLTEEQIKIWSDAEKAQLEVQKEALKKGIFIQGDMNMGKLGGHGGRAWGGCTVAPTTPTTSTTVN